MTLDTNNFIGVHIEDIKVGIIGHDNKKLGILAAKSAFIKLYLFEIKIMIDNRDLLQISYQIINNNFVFIPICNNQLVMDRVNVLITYLMSPFYQHRI